MVDDIALKPKMERHTENYTNINKRNEVYSQIVDGADKHTHNKMVLVDCYWSQTAHSASLNGFYYGYRAAHSITDCVALMEYNYIDRISKQIKRLEQALVEQDIFEQHKKKLTEIVASLTEYIFKRTELATQELNMPNPYPHVDRVVNSKQL